jgi:hypothetical protein
MGSLGSLKRAARVGVVLLAAAASASAQDFGSRWADRLVQELYAQRGPLETDFKVDASGGAFVYWDNNIHLDATAPLQDTVIVPFVSARLAYAEPELDAVAELVANFKAYLNNSSANDDEERFYGRLRYVGSELTAGVVAIFRHESDPTDVVFATRVDRIVGEVLPQFAYDLSPVFSVEVSGLVQIVRHEDPTFSASQDNENYSAKLGLVYELEGGVQVVVEGGYTLILYRGPAGSAPPDVNVWFSQAGFRGELFPNLVVSVLAGAIGAQSDDFTVPPSPGLKDTSGTASVILRYTGLERFDFSASYHRTVAFGGANDPYQIVNRVLLRGDLEVNEVLRFGGRVQVEMTQSALQVRRDYVSLGIHTTVTPHEHLIFDGGLSYRFGDRSGTAPAMDYNDLILYVGIALAY